MTASPPKGQPNRSSGAEILRFPPHRIRRDREPWSTKADVMAYLQVSDRWIELRYRDGLPHHKDVRSRLVRFKLSEIDEWLASRRPTA